MDKQTWLILFTALGAFGTVIAPIIAWQLTKEHQKRKNDARQQQLLANIIAHAPSPIEAGEWHGFSVLQTGPEDYKGRYSVLCKFEVEDHKLLIGEYSYWPEHNVQAPQISAPPATLALRGGFNDGRFLTLWLEGRNPENVHFGIMICELANNKQKLRGIWIAFGLHAGEFISGVVELKRK